MAQKAKTAAELEEERRRRDAEWWNKVIVFYLNQMYHQQVDREVEKYRPKLLVEQMADRFREQRQKEKHETLLKLTEREPGQLSALDLLQRMQAYQEEDSPFRKLQQTLRESPEDEEKLSEAVDRVVEEAPEQILNRGRRNAIHRHRRLGPAEAAIKEEQPEALDPEQQRQEEERLRCEMAFLQKYMSPEKYQALFRELVSQGRIKPQDLGAEIQPPPEQTGRSYEEFIAAHRTLPREREGELGNRDELFTAAAYLLAGYEQKDEPVFDEKRADARAMELSGSKAFRLYMKEHTGSLLAAAQNTGLEVTHGDLAALERKLRQRDGVLTAVRDALRTRASGKSGDYHKLVNALDRFVSDPNEPSKRRKDALALSLAQYVMTEGDPKNPAYERDMALQAARALQALLPEKEFQTFLLTANGQRSPAERITPEKLAALAARQPEAAPQPGGPVQAGPGA